MFNKLKALVAFLIIFFIGIILYFIFSASSRPSCKKVMFMATTETAGGKGVYELYQEMKKAGHEVKIAMYPVIVEREGKDVTILDFDKSFADKFDHEDVVYPCGNQAPYPKCNVIEKSQINNYEPDYVFVYNPYNADLNASLRKISKKLIHIVYGPYIFYQKQIADPQLPSLVDVVFVDSEVTKEIFIEDYKFSKDCVIVSGYQTYKEIKELHAKSSKHDRETILWMPRWRLDFRDRKNCEGGSTFLNYHYFFYNYAAAHPEMHFILRPHHGIFMSSVPVNHLSQTDLDGIFDRFKKLENVTISYHSTQPLINDIDAADIVIGDGTSALAEAVIDDKPIIYLSNGMNYEFTSNALSRALEKYVYLAYEPNEIASYINVIRENKYRALDYPPCTGLKCTLLKIKCKMLGQICTRDDFKKALDPVENPAKTIAEYISYDSID